MCRIKSADDTLGSPFHQRPTRDKRQHNAFGIAVHTSRVGAVQVYGHAASMGIIIVLSLSMLDGQHLAEAVARAKDASLALLGRGSVRWALLFL
jgi:hypothetical protein